jgi:hypothetical protein
MMVKCCGLVETKETNKMNIVACAICGGVTCITILWWGMCVCSLGLLPLIWSVGEWFVPKKADSADMDADATDSIA